MRYLLAACLALLVAAVAQADPAVSRLRVLLPAEAELWVNNFKSKKSTEERFFTIPNLKPGVEKTYLVKARVYQNGKYVTRVKRVSVSPGRVYTVRFTFDQAAPNGGAPATTNGPSPSTTTLLPSGGTTPVSPKSTGGGGSTTGFTGAVGGGSMGGGGSTGGGFASAGGMGYTPGGAGATGSGYSAYTYDPKTKMVIGHNLKTGASSAPMPASAFPGLNHSGAVRPNTSLPGGPGMTGFGGGTGSFGGPPGGAFFPGGHGLPHHRP